MPNTLTKAENFDGRILGYTRIQNETISGTTNQTIGITSLNTWVQLATAQGTKVSITFVSPPSGNVEIDLHCLLLSSADKIHWSLGTSHSSYIAIATKHEYNEKNQEADESEINWHNPRWAITGLTAGTSYTYYLWIRTTGNIYFYHGESNHHAADYNSAPILMKVAALPATIVTGE